MKDLAQAYQYAGQPQEAIRLLGQTLETQKAKRGPDDIDLDILYLLAGTYQNAGKLDEADRLLRDLHERLRKRGGKMYIYRGPQASLGLNLGLNLLKQQQFAKAEPLLRERLAIDSDNWQRLAIDSDNWLHFNAMSLLGGALLGQENYPAAEPLLLRGYEGMKKREAQILPSEKGCLTEAVERIIHFYEATRQEEKARAWRETLPQAKGSEKKE
jgi:tetratricopeptide (TPR) repeat protein